MWTEEEDKTLKRNMMLYPRGQHSPFKWYSLLMSNLSNKRLRDVTIRVNYYEQLKVDPECDWEDFFNESITRNPRQTMGTRSPNHRSYTSSGSSLDSESESSTKSMNERGELSPMLDGGYDDALTPNTAQVSQRPKDSMGTQKGALNICDTGTKRSTFVENTRPRTSNAVLERGHKFQLEPVLQPMFQTTTYSPSGMLQEGEIILRDIVNRALQNGVVNEHDVCRFHSYVDRMIQNSQDLCPGMVLPMFCSDPLNSYEIANMERKMRAASTPVPSTSLNFTFNRTTYF